MKKLFTLLAAAALCMLLPAAASAAGNQTIGGVVYQFDSSDNTYTVAPQIKAIAGTQSQFTIESKYTIFNFVADGDNYALPVDVYDDGKLVGWNTAECSDAYIRVSDSNVECGVDNSLGFYIRSSAAGSGTETVGYKDAEKTFAYNFYNMEFDISPASVSVAVGESATIAGTLRFTMPGKEPVIANDITLRANMRKNGTGMTGSGEYFKLESNGASVTLTVLADPGEGDYSIYVYRSRFSAPDEGYWNLPMNSAVIPVAIAGAAPVVLAVALPNGTVNISDADKRETPLAIVADQGWKISTVTLGGDDITSQLSDEGAYTVPVLTESKALNVVFVQETQTAVADLDASEAPKVYAAGGEVRIEGAEPGAEVRVYDLAGRCLMVTTDHVFAAPGRGVRILTVAGRTYKFAL